MKIDVNIVSWFKINNVKSINLVKIYGH
jgi:hypothetical protein